MTTVSAHRFFAALVAVVLACLTAAVQIQAGPYKVTLETEPTVLEVGRAKLRLHVSTEDGKPVDGAAISTMVKMPAMNMGEKEEMAAPTGAPGDYEAPCVLAMAGSYEARLTIEGPAGKGEATIPLATGQAAGGGLPGWLPWAVGLLLAGGIVLWRVRVTGQKVSLKALANRGTVVSLLLIAVAVAASNWAVKNLRRPGAMDPIEAQVMDMNTPAPTGYLPVVLAEAKRAPFGKGVSYQASAAAYISQEVVPRVTGKIISMPVYVGDRVRKGQVVARLDTSSQDPMVSERAAGVSAASQGVAVAASEHQQALKAAEQARQELLAADADVQEAASLTEAAEASVSAAASMVTSAQTDVQSAQAESDAKAANLQFLNQELERSQQLYEKGYIALKELQRVQAEQRAAKAAVASSQEAVRKAEASVKSAQAERQRAAAERTAAARRLTRAQASLRVGRLRVQNSDLAASAARKRIGQAQAAAAQASASLRGATTERGYADLRSEVDGFVVKRLVAPGVTVSMGQPVMLLSANSPIRFQAQVPENQLAGISVGDPVRVTMTSGGQPLLLKVSSIQPAIDPAARSGIVEALYPNLGGKVFPGQAASMVIAAGGESWELVVPSDALVTREDRTTVWVAQPGMNGEFTVREQEVTVRGVSGELAAVRAGLSPGDKVVIAPSGLMEGDKVMSATTDVVAGPSEVTIQVTEAGFVPPVVTVPAGKEATLTFIRKIEGTCATEAIFKVPALRVDIPLNHPVTLRVPAQPKGTRLIYGCSMDMVKGTVEFQ